METKERKPEPKIPEAKKEEVAKPEPKVEVAKPEPTPAPAAPKVKNPNEGLTQRFGRGVTWWEDADGNVVSEEPLPRKDAIAALEALQKPKVQKVKKAKKAKKEEEIKDDERKDEDGTLDD